MMLVLRDLIFENTELIAIFFIFFSVIANTRNLIEISKFWKHFLLFVFTFSFLAFVLYIKWTVLHPFSGIGYFNVGGYLPLSDSSNYLTTALHFIETGSLNSWGLSVRSLITYFLASILHLFQGDFQTALLFLTILGGGAIFLLAQLILNRYGVALSLFASYILCLSYASYLGEFSCENLGFIFGCVGITFFLNALFYKKGNYFLFGLMLFSIASTIRAGAIIIIPLLIAYFSAFLAYSEKKKVDAEQSFKNKFITFFNNFNKVIFSKLLFLGLLVTFLCLSSNRILDSISSPNIDGVAYANFSHILYNMANDVPGWMLVFDHYPELETMDVEKRAQIIYDKTIETIKEKPVVFISSYFKRLLSVTKQGFSFFNKSNFFTGDVNAFVLFILMGIGLIYLFKISNVVFFFIISLLGIWLSSPFLIIPGRVYAVTMPIIAILFPVLLGEFFYNRTNTDKVFLPNRGIRYLFAFSFILIGLLYIFPFTIPSKNQDVSMYQNHCQSGETFVFRMPMNSYLRAVNQPNAYMLRPDINIKEYQKDNPTKTDEKPVFELLKEGDYLVHVFNLINFERAFLILDNYNPKSNEDLEICCVEDLGIGLYGIKVFRGKDSKIIKG